MLSIKNLTLNRGDKQLINTLDIQVAASNIVVVLGPNGAGKSTLLLAIMGLFQAKNGEVFIQEQTVQNLSRQAIANLITWQGDLPPSEFGLTVGQRLALVKGGDNQQVIEDALKYMELTNLEARALGDLSSGERQRVEIAATMVSDNPIWLMDEPTAHLDMRHQVDCLKLIKQEAKQGRLILTVLHDLQQAAAVADIVILLDGQGGVEVGLAEVVLKAERLEPIFGVKLKGSGRDLMPVYGGDIDEET